MGWIKRRGLFLPEVLDLCAPYLALGQSIGRIGCFLNGCCYGKEVSWGIYFPVHGAHLHPTQLYLSGGLFLIFLLLKLYQRSSSIPGLVFASYLILTSVLRFGVEFFRADHEILFLGLSVFQFVCLGVLVFAFGFAYWMLIKHSHPQEQP
jgi:phosphatidylglycerol:prolipoprotein diacylglycerol transferase